MSKTNFDDLDLAVPGIEADEINTESIAAGQVLMADVRAAQPGAMAGLR